MEFLTLFLFVLVLILGNMLRFFPVILLLAMFGALLVLRFRLGDSGAALQSLILEAVVSQKELLLVLFLSGALTPLLTLAGTTPTAVLMTPVHLSPFLFLLFFAVNAVFGFCTASPIVTAASAGTICLSVSLSMRLDPAVAGGAILSGAFFGALVSPSFRFAHRAAECAGADPALLTFALRKETLAPAGVSAVIFLLLGVLAHSKAQSGAAMIASLDFNPGPFVFLPLLVILVLGILRLRPILQIAGGILSAAVTAMLLQHVSVFLIILDMITGYRIDEDAGALLSGGGMLSVIPYAFLLCLSACCVKLLGSFLPKGAVPEQIRELAVRHTPCAAILCTAALSAFPALTEDLDLTLTDSMSASLSVPAERRALCLTVFCLLIPALLPWSVTSGIPLFLIRSSGRSLFFASFLYLLPCYELLLAMRRAYQ